jgi:hypothetical protein
MGREIETRVTIAGVRRNARLHLDSKALQIAGRPRREIALASIHDIEVRGGTLVLDLGGEVVDIELGEQAPAWASKLRNPPSRARKLGLKAGLNVALLGETATELGAEVTAAGAALVPLRSGADLVFLSVDDPRELSQLPELATRIAKNGAIWVLRRKGRGAPVGEGEMRAAAHAAGLVAVKVAAFSPTHTADKLVIPVAARSAHAAARSGAPAPGKPTRSGRPGKVSKKKAAKTRGAAARRLPGRTR